MKHLIHCLSLFFIGTLLVACNAPLVPTTPTGTLIVPTDTIEATTAVATATEAATEQAPVATATAQPAPATATATTAATVTLLPTITLTPPPTATPLPTLTPTAVPPTATPVPTPAPVTGVWHMVVNVEPNDVLNVRSGPGISYNIVGTLLPYAPNVLVTGSAELVGPSRWVPITYGAVSGWVNAGYLAKQEGLADIDAIEAGFRAVIALRDRNVARLSQLAHPTKGVLFSPEGYVDTGNHLTFSSAQIAAAAGDPTVHTWGWHPGSGEPIELTFMQYLADIVYDQDYADPDVIGLNTRVSYGNTIVNMPDVFPEATIIEYHFPGFNPDYGGLDWASLRIALEEVGGNWYLVAVSNDYWTP